MTLACEDSRNLSLSYQLLSVLTFMLLTLEQTKAILLMSEPAKSHVIINFYRTQVFGNVLYVTLTRYLEKLFRDFGQLCFTLS